MKKFLTLINIGLILNLVLLAYKFTSLWRCVSILPPKKSTLQFQEYFHNTKNYFAYSNKLFLNNKNTSQNSQTSLEKCTMKKCFNFTKCADITKFKIHIHYLNETTNTPSSSIYKNILSLIKRSKYYTTNFNEACLFILPFDTLSRDRLSSSYIRDLKLKLESIGWTRTNKYASQNYLIFNLYSGSYPAYDENQLDIDFDGDDGEEEENRAILAKASFSLKYYRKNFDLAFPLFHSEMPVNHTRQESGNVKINYDLLLIRKQRKKYLLTFKGKRYLHGIGTETRNSIYHLNNERDILLLTTW